MLFQATIEFGNGWRTILPYIDAEDYTIVTDTILKEYAPYDIIRIIVIERKDDE